MSPLGFKARVDSFVFTWQRCMCYTLLEIHLETSPADPIHIPATSHWWDSNGRPIMSQTNALLNELCWLGCFGYFRLDELDSEITLAPDVKVG